MFWINRLNTLTHNLVNVSVACVPVISDDIKVSTTTVYLGLMVALFLITGILHLGEFLFLLHGLWFFLCLPAGYLILMIYSICNITDRSWGKIAFH